MRCSILMMVLMLLVLAAPVGFSKELVTNQIQFENAPEWLSTVQLRDAVDRIQNYLEWDIRRIQVFYYASAEEFKAKHHLNFVAEAFFNRADSTIHLSPLVNHDNFDRIFGHELVHAVFFQKYKGAIPVWLEEGFANYIGKKTSPDYVWLATQDLRDVTQLKHPSQDASGSRYHYSVSTALIEMIASKCSLKDVLELSVGKNVTTYLQTFCGITDINADFRAWVQKQKNSKPGTSSDSSAPWWKKPQPKQFWQKR